jgi:hypothetical protein
MTTMDTETTAPMHIYAMVPEDYAVWEHLCCRLAGIPRGLPVEHCGPAMQWEERLRRDDQHDADNTRRQPDSALITHIALLSAEQNNKIKSSAFRDPAYP